MTGTLECLGDAPSTTESTSTEAETGGDGVVHLHRWAASDPRLSGEATYSGRWQLYDEPAEESGDPAASDAALYAIVNEGGSWLCEASRPRSRRISTLTGIPWSSTARAITRV